MVYIYSVFSIYNFKSKIYPNIKELSNNIKFIWFNTENYNFEIIFHFSNTKIIKQLDITYDTLTDTEYLDEIDFLDNGNITGLKKIYIYVYNNDNFDVFTNNLMSNYLDTVELVYSQKEIDEWNEIFKTSYKTDFINIMLHGIQVFNIDYLIDSDDDSDSDFYYTSDSDSDNDNQSDIENEDLENN